MVQSIYEGSINMRQLFLLSNVRVTNVTILDPHCLFNLTLGGEQVTKPNHRMEKRSSRSLGVWLGPWWEWLSQITWDNGLNPQSPPSISRKYLRMFSLSAVLLFNLFKLWRLVNKCRINALRSIPNWWLSHKLSERLGRGSKKRFYGICHNALDRIGPLFNAQMSSSTKYF